MGTTLQNRRKSNMAAILQYSILFCILVLGIYGLLILGHKSFIKSGDGAKQAYFWVLELKRAIEMLLAGKGLRLWSWSKFLGMVIQTNRYWDPFNWFAALFPLGYIELGYTIAVLLRIYCGGAAFLALMRYSGRSVYASVFSAAAYAFSGFTIATGMSQADFLMNAYLFPLLVLSVEAVYKGKSPAFFSLAIGLYLVSNFYDSYMAAISIILYIMLRYFAYRKFDWKDYAKNTGRFAFYGVIGLLVGGIQFVPDFVSLSWASTESIKDKVGILFDSSYYIRMGEKMIGTGEIKAPTMIGWTLIVIILLVIAIAGLKLSKTPALMSLILFVGLMLPAVCSMYNGFGYPSQRWIFALELFAAWAAAEEIDGSRLLSRQGVTLAVVTLGVMAFLSLGMSGLFDTELEKRAVTFIAVQLIGGLAFVVLLALVRKDGHLKSLSKAMILVIFAGTMTAAWTVSFMDNRGVFYRNNKLNKMMEKSTQRAGALIEDDSFYRIDQVDSMLYSHRVKYPPNETLWWLTRSIYGYNSRVPSDLLEFNRLAGNNYGYSKRVAVISNDNRTGLDYLCGVKYFLGNDLKNGRTESDEYAGYGFEEFTNLDGVNVFRSKYDVSLGYVFDRWISQSEFEKLGYAEREQALLQALVIPDAADDSDAEEATDSPGAAKTTDSSDAAKTSDSYGAEDAANSSGVAKTSGSSGTAKTTDSSGVEDAVITSAASEVKAGDIKTAVKDVKFTVTESDGATLKDGVIVVKKEGGSITIEPAEFRNSQLLLSMTGLLRNVREGQSKSFEMHVKNNDVEEIADNNRNNQTIPNIKDYNLNLGYYDKYDGGKIKIAFSKKGKYYYDDIRLRAMDADLFDACIGALSDKRYKIDSFSDTMVKGSVDANDGGILFLSIIEPERWECYIDGEKAETIKDADIAFLGAKIPAGHHDVTLRFRSRSAEKGVMVSVAGLVILAAACLIRRRREKK